MTVRLFADQTRVAIYEEAPGGGDPTDVNSAMNRPVLTPMSWLPYVYFHSDFNYYNTFAYNLNAVISHPEVAGKTNEVTLQTKFLGTFVYYDYLLLTHNLGYVPRFFVASDGVMLPNGYPVQRPGAGRMRFVTAYATTSQIRLKEFAVSSDTALVAADISYQVLAFADSAVNPALNKLLLQPGNVVFGQGKFRMDQPPLRVVASGESPFSVARTRTAAIGNGALRVYPPTGAPIDFGTFAGTLPAPNYITVQVGV